MYDIISGIVSGDKLVLELRHIGNNRRVGPKIRPVSDVEYHVQTQTDELILLAAVNAVTSPSPTLSLASPGALEPVKMAVAIAAKPSTTSSRPEVMLVIRADPTSSLFSTYWVSWSWKGIENIDVRGELLRQVLRSDQSLKDTSSDLNAVDVTLQVSDLTSGKTGGSYEMIKSEDPSPMEVT